MTNDVVMTLQDGNLVEASGNQVFQFSTPSDPYGTITVELTALTDPSDPTGSVSEPLSAYVRYFTHLFILSVSIMCTGLTCSSLLVVVVLRLS